MNKPAPFSRRQYDYFLRCYHNWFNVAEGGKRGGKNVLQTLAFCTMLETHRNKIHLVAGVSSATAKLNILDCDGYGLLNYFEGRCREGKYKDRDCVYIKTKTGEKIVLVSGGGKDGDEKLIKGNTYGMAYVTEANECHPKFLKEVFDRTLSSSDRKIFHDLNPKEEEHWYYTDILGFHEKNQEDDSGYGYNYGHFTIVDNMSLSDSQIRAALKTYQKDTVWYRRDIKGERAVAEGIIFGRFAGNPAPYLYEDSELLDLSGTGEKAKLKKRPFKFTIGIDFGGNGSMTTFVAAAYFNRYHDIRIMEESCIDKLSLIHIFVTELEAEIRMIKKTNKDAHDRIGDLEAMLNESREEAAELQRQLEESREEAAELRAKLNENQQTKSGKDKKGV